MIKLAHLSDVHLAPLPPVRPTQLLNKRITGFANWKLRREPAFAENTLDALTGHMKAQNPDLVAISGDLTNLSLPDEFSDAGKWLQTLGPAQSVCTIPGNHDVYIPGALKKAHAAWGDYMNGETLDGADFPYVRRIGDVAVIGCNSSIATPPFFAAGRFDKAQADRLSRILKLTGDGGYFRVVMIHHSPHKVHHSWRRGLWQADLFRQILAENGAEMVLSGHIHRSEMNYFDGPNGEIPAFTVAAGCAGPGDHKGPGRYNLFGIERKGEGWSVTLREFGYQRIGNDISLRLQARIY